MNSHSKIILSHLIRLQNLSGLSLTHKIIFHKEIKLNNMKCELSRHQMILQKNKNRKYLVICTRFLRPCSVCVRGGGGGVGVTPPIGTESDWEVRRKAKIHGLFRH